jgi:hypothetical protein
MNKRFVAIVIHPSKIGPTYQPIILEDTSASQQTVNSYKIVHEVIAFEATIDEAKKIGYAQLNWQKG